jgi:hypothetical protein
MRFVVAMATWDIFCITSFKMRKYRKYLIKRNTRKKHVIEIRSLDWTIWIWGIIFVSIIFQVWNGVKSHVYMYFAHQIFGNRVYTINIQITFWYLIFLSAIEQRQILRRKIVSIDYIKFLQNSVFKYQNLVKTRIAETNHWLGQLFFSEVCSRDVDFFTCFKP